MAWWDSPRGAGFSSKAAAGAQDHLESNKKNDLVNTTCHTSPHYTGAGRQVDGAGPVLEQQSGGRGDDPAAWQSPPLEDLLA